MLSFYPSTLFRTLPLTIAFGRLDLRFHCFTFPSSCHGAISIRFPGKLKGTNVLNLPDNRSSRGSSNTRSRQFAFIFAENSVHGPVYMSFNRPRIHPYSGCSFKKSSAIKLFEH